MIIDYYQAELQEKKIFVRAKFRPPLKATQLMVSEACLLYNVKGPSFVYGGDKTENLSSEEGALMKCGNYISDWKATDENEIFEVITIHFYPEVLKDVFENHIPEYLVKSENKSGRLLQKINKNAVLRSYINSLIMYFDNPELFNSDTIKLKIKELIALLYRLDSNGIREILSDLFNPSELDFKKIIDAHIFDNLSLSELSALTHLSTSSFNRKFRAVYGASPGKYILSKKLEKASELLAISSKRISDICFESGFTDLSNFSKQFRRHFGVSPSAFQMNKE